MLGMGAPDDGGPGVGGGMDVGVGGMGRLS